jgi:hypothetical protein
MRADALLQITPEIVARDRLFKSRMTAEEARS